MSSENYVGIIMAENLRFLGEGSKALLFYFKRADPWKMRGIEQIPAVFVLFE